MLTESTLKNHLGAERVAIFTAVVAGQRQIQTLAVIADTQ